MLVCMYLCVSTCSRYGSVQTYGDIRLSRDRDKAAMTSGVPTGIACYRTYYRIIKSKEEGWVWKRSTVTVQCVVHTEALGAIVTCSFVTVPVPVIGLDLYAVHVV